MTKNSEKNPPSAGERLSAAIRGEFELAEHELVLLAEAAKTLDTCVLLQELVDRGGLLAPTNAGERAAPALVELRAQRLTLARLLAAMRIPVDEQERTQRRGPRGVYGVAK